MTGWRITERDPGAYFPLVIRSSPGKILYMAKQLRAPETDNGECVFMVVTMIEANRSQGIAAENVVEFYETRDEARRAATDAIGKGCSVFQAQIERQG